MDGVAPSFQEQGPHLCLAVKKVTLRYYFKGLVRRSVLTINQQHFIFKTERASSDLAVLGHLPRCGGEGIYSVFLLQYTEWIV